MFTDAELLVQVASGNERAFQCLFERHRSKIYNYLFSIVKSREIAEELVIDVFLKLWIGRELLTEIQNMDAFLHKVAYNKAIDFLRITSRNIALQKVVNREIESSREREADYRLQEQEYREIINRAIQQLSPQRRMVFTLSRVEGLNYDQIAKQLHLSRNTVRNTMADTLRSIRSYLLNNEISPVLLLLIGIKL
ncbi:MAG: RNA polymerase sigma-70 factor [Chitinophagaceae bacterium]|nr:RNA polymerase sigma-70 factor [Chitinophagaceae bacterium]